MSSLGEDLSQLMVARTGRAAKAGSRAGRLVKLVRLTRLTRLMRLGKVFKQARRLQSKSVISPKVRAAVVLAPRSCLSTVAGFVLLHA